MKTLRIVCRPSCELNQSLTTFFPKYSGQGNVWASRLLSQMEERTDSHLVYRLNSEQVHVEKWEREIECTWGRGNI